MVYRRDHIIVNHTPKFQPDIFGENIEYSWACKNNYYIQL